MSYLADCIAKLLDDHTQRDIYSRAGDVISTSCYGCDWTPASGVSHEIHSAQVVSTYVREHFTDHADELGLTRHNHYMAVPDETRTECACGSGNQPTRQVPAHRYMTELMPDE